jgi:hypothetical protein
MSYNTINNFNIFGSIENINANTTYRKIIEIDTKYKNNYTITHLGLNLNSNNLKSKKNIKKILKHILPHIRYKGKCIKKENCIVMDILDAPGAYFPIIHTDIEWGMTNRIGFQVWYLHKKSSCKNNYGNMFIFETYDELSEKTTNIYYDTNEKQIIRKNYQTGDSNYINPNDINVKYLDMREGDCLIFSSNVQHLSDWRLKNNDRVALNFRVIIDERKSNMPIFKTNNLNIFHKFKILYFHYFTKNKEGIRFIY